MTAAAAPGGAQQLGDAARAHLCDAASYVFWDDIGTVLASSFTVGVAVPGPAGHGPLACAQSARDSAASAYTHRRDTQRLRHRARSPTPRPPYCSPAHAHPLRPIWVPCPPAGKARGAAQPCGRARRPQQRDQAWLGRRRAALRGVWRPQRARRGEAWAHAGACCRVTTGRHPCAHAAPTATRAPGAPAPPAACVRSHHGRCGPG